MECIIYRFHGERETGASRGGCGRKRHEEKKENTSQERERESYKYIVVATMCAHIIIDPLISRCSFRRSNKSDNLDKDNPLSLLAGATTYMYIYIVNAETMQSGH